MPLTPIRVRGKRKPRDTTTNPKKRTREEDAQNRAYRSPKIRQLRVPKKSLLERELPLEIIELIFTYSENVNFPRSSPLLGRLLSGRQTLVGTVVAAFGPTWDATFGSAEGVPHRFSKNPLEVPAGFPIDEVPGNPNFQVGPLISQVHYQQDTLRRLTMFLVIYHCLSMGYRRNHPRGATEVGSQNRKGAQARRADVRCPGLV